MSGVAVVCLIATWRDEHLLERAVASAAPHVDRVVVLDGSYADIASEDAVDGRGHELAETPYHELIRARERGAVVFGAGESWQGRRPWRDEITKRNVLLELGRAALADVPGERWALVLDADEELERGEHLRNFIAFATDCKARPVLIRVEPDGSPWWAPSRLFPLTDSTRYAGRSYWLSGAEGPWGDLSHAPATAADLGDRGAPIVRHRWDQRSPWRAEIQRRWGRRLAELDHGDAAA